MICREDSPPTVQHFSSTDAVADWIDNCVLGDLRTLAEGIAARVRQRLERELPQTELWPAIPRPAAIFGGTLQ